MSLQNAARSYYTENIFNCSQALIRACNDVYELQISPEDLWLFDGFGGGLSTGNMCGALSAPAAALSKMVVLSERNKPDYSDQTCAAAIRKAMVLLNRNFRKLSGESQCSVLKAKNFDPENRCLKTVLQGAAALEQTVADLGLSEKK